MNLQISVILKLTRHIISHKSLRLTFWRRKYLELYWRLFILKSFINPIEDGHFRGCSRKGFKKVTPPKIYPTMMKLGTAIPYLRKIQNIYDTPPDFCWHQISLKITVFWNKGYDVIISVDNVTNKILSHDSNYIVDVLIWPKFGDCNISIGEVITTSIL